MLDITTKETRLYQEGLKDGLQEGRQEGRQEAIANIVIRQLKKRFGEFPESKEVVSQKLSVKQWEELSEALLDFRTLADYQDWLKTHGR